VRGAEIKAYLVEHPEINYYIIIDDDTDMLPEQSGHFIKTDPLVGFTIRDFKKFEEIFMQDVGRGGSFIEKKCRDYRQIIEDSPQTQDEYF
jgi:hypothetical protein